MNTEVTRFLDEQNHPLRAEIERLREIIISSVSGLSENIKWNGPNYSFEGADRISMKIQPPKQIQIIFHRGAKKQDQPKEKLIQTNTKLLTWKENDRAIATFKSAADIQEYEPDLRAVVAAWIGTS